MAAKGNEKCTCGSGKLFKNCCKNKSKSSLSVTIDIDKSNFDKLDGIAISSEGVVSGHKGGVLMPLFGNNSITFRNSNTKRKKLLTEGQSFDDFFHIDPDSILAPYDNILVVDTNTKEDFFEGNKVSVSTLIHCVIEKLPDKKISVQYSLIGAWEFWNLKGLEEQHFWWFLINAIENGESDKVYKSGKMAILTDCDQINHKIYNKNEKPIFEDALLPERYAIIYATSDSARDLPNQLLRRCDSFCNTIMGLIKDKEQLTEVTGLPYTHRRKWIPDIKDESWVI